MLDQDVKIGMKVVPHSKSMLTDLSESKTWARAQIVGQPFLYVVNSREAVGNIPINYSLSDEEDRLTGDRFLASDFEPYVEDKKGAGEETALPAVKTNSFYKFMMMLFYYESREVKWRSKERPTKFAEAWLKYGKDTVLFVKKKKKGERLMFSHKHILPEGYELVSYKEWAKGHKGALNEIDLGRYFPLPEDFKRFTSMLRWALVAQKANDGKTLVSNGWYVYKSGFDGEIQFSETNPDKYGLVLFPTKESIQKAYEENKILVDNMLG
jgi:hypothetical protein